jgi:virulence factor Mce-like protein
MTPSRSKPRGRGNEQARYRRAAIIAALGFVAITVFVFAHQSLTQGGYRIRADVSTASQLRTGSEVRTAGIKVGQVTGISRGPDNTSMLDISIDGNGLPVHDDASLTVKPRLLLEGNAYIDLNTGSPGAPDLQQGTTIPLARTAVSVQLDQVIDTFDAPTRGALTRSIGGLASGLGNGSPASTSDRGPGYAALRDAVRAFDGSLGSVAQVASAARGTRPGDLGHAVVSSSAFTAQLAQDPAALANSVSAFNRVLGALAAEDQPLALGIRNLDGLLTVAPGSLTKINAALPPLTSFANALRPAMQAAPIALTKTNRLLDQVDALVQPAALPRLLDQLAPVTAQLPQLEQELRGLFGYTTQVTDCIGTHVVPVLNSKITDGANTTGDPAWLDLLHGVTGFTSASTSFDGNAGTFRAGLAFGLTALQGIIPGLGTFVGQLVPQIEGVRPKWLGYGVEPPYRPDQPCATQQLPNLNAQSGPAPNWSLHPAVDRTNGKP